MEFSTGSKGPEQPIVDLFTATFTMSEGKAEGALIGKLARALLGGTPEADLLACTAEEAGVIVGGILFSRLFYDQDDRTVFVLGPVAVMTEHQGKGIGQKLLAYGLRELRAMNVDIVITYGDPRYYSKVGFMPITEAFARAPFKLKYPQGWQAQSLTDAEMAPLTGPARCVEALADPVFW